jgi:hypothetical protein
MPTGNESNSSSLQETGRCANLSELQRAASLTGTNASRLHNSERCANLSELQSNMSFAPQASEQRV